MSGLLDDTGGIFLFSTFSSTIQGVVNMTWPMLLISIVVLVSFRISYIIKKNDKFVFYKELLMLSFIIYILCLFQVVTFTDDVTWSTNNFIPFKEILRYSITSRLFLKNVIGNMLMFLPFGFFISYYLENKKPYLTIFLTLIASIAIEIVQLSIGRVFDVDDIILNLCGGLLGYGIYYLMYKVSEKIPSIFKTEWFLNGLSIIILLGILLLI